MNWIKKSGITLLTFLSLSFAMPSNAMSFLDAPKKLDALTDALKKLNIDQKTIEELIKIIERLEKSGLEIIAQLNTTLNETIQGSSELKSLGDIQRNIETLINKEIPEYKAKSIGTSAKSDKENKRAVASESESKEQASRAAQLSLTPEPTQLEQDRKFIAITIQPVLATIDATLKELHANIQQRITTYTAEQKKLSESQKKEQRDQDDKIKEASQKTSTLSSLEEKKESLNKIRGRLKIIHSLISPQTLILPGTSILNQITTELTALNKVVGTEIIHFKGGLAGVLDDTIKGLTDGLSNTGKTISTNIAEDLQRNLRAAIGSSEIIKSIEDINQWLITYKNPRNRTENKDFIIKITTYINQLEERISGLQFYHIPQALFEIIGKFKSALARYQEAIKHDAGDGKQTFAANEALYQAICQSNFELLDCVQGTLASLINVLKHNLLGVVDRFNEGFGHTISQLNNNIDKNVNQFNRELRVTINKDLPRTLKKGIGYLTLGTIAACAVCHIIWHDRPWQGHLKNIGIAAGSIISMFFVDPIVNYFYRPSRTVRSAE